MTIVCVSGNIQMSLLFCESTVWGGEGGLCLFELRLQIISSLTSQYKKKTESF